MTYKIWISSLIIVLLLNGCTGDITEVHDYSNYMVDSWEFTIMDGTDGIQRQTNWDGSISGSTI